MSKCVTRSSNCSDAGYHLLTITVGLNQFPDRLKLRVANAKHEIWKGLLSAGFLGPELQLVWRHEISSHFLKTGSPFLLHEPMWSGWP